MRNKVVLDVQHNRQLKDNQITSKFLIGQIKKISSSADSFVLRSSRFFASQGNRTNL